MRAERPAAALEPWAQHSGLGEQIPRLATCGSYAPPVRLKTRENPPVSSQAFRQKPRFCRSYRAKVRLAS